MIVRIKKWYKQEYQKFKRRNAWTHACCRSQALELKKLRKRIQELELKIKEMGNEITK